MAAVAASGSTRGSVVDRKRHDAADRGGGARPPSGWGADKPLAYSDVAHLGVDSVLFALVRCIYIHLTQQYSIYMKHNVGRIL